MSRTDGGFGFLSPIHVGLQKGRKGRGSIDDISDEMITQYNEKEGSS